MRCLGRASVKPRGLLFPALAFTYMSRSPLEAQLFRTSLGEAVSRGERAEGLGGGGKKLSIPNTNQGNNLEGSPLRFCAVTPLEELHNGKSPRAGS